MLYVKCVAVQSVFIFFFAEYLYILTFYSNCIRKSFGIKKFILHLLLKYLSDLCKVERDEQY